MQQRALVKHLALSGVGVCLALLASFTLLGFANSGNGARGVIAAIAFTGFLAVFVIQTIPIHEGHPRSVVIAIIVQTVALASPLFAHITSKWFWLFGVLALLFLIAAYERGRALVNDMAKVRFSMIARFILPRAVTAISIFAVMFFYESGGALRSGFVGTSVSAAVRSTEPVLQRFFGGISIDQPVKEFFGAVAEERFKDATREEREGAAEQAFLQIQKNLADSFHITILPSDRVSDIIEGAVRGGIASIAGNMFGASALALLLFFVLRGIGAIVSIIALPITWVLYKLLLTTKFLRIQVEERPNEKIVL